MYQDGKHGRRALLSGKDVRRIEEDLEGNDWVQ